MKIMKKIMSVLVVLFLALNVAAPMRTVQYRLSSCQQRHRSSSRLTSQIRRFPTPRLTTSWYIRSMR